MLDSTNRWLYESFIELSPNTHDHSQSNHVFFLSTLTHILSALAVAIARHFGTSTK
jgi:hypothetical protein